MRDRLGRQTPTAQIGCWQASLAPSPDSSPGFGILGRSGNADWPIVRRGIAVAMGEAESDKGPVDLYTAERVAQGWATLDHPA